MNVEVMLYVYGFVCASMIVFNVVYNLLLKRSEPRLERRCRRLREKIELQLARLRDGGAVELGGHHTGKIVEIQACSPPCERSSPP